MASAKDLKKRIRTTSNTSKITRTMEMVATARSKLAQKRVELTTPYSRKLAEILGSMAAAGTIEHPLLVPAETVERSALLIVTGNRGLCGGYNTNVLNLADRWRQAEESEGREVDTYVIGKKGLSRFRFLGVEVKEGYTHIEDKPSFDDADEIAQRFMAQFLGGEIQQVQIASTRYHSSSKQSPELTQLLPIEAATGGEEDTSAKGADFEFEPDRDAILNQLLPLSVSQMLFRLFLEAAVSEQIARRIAMKLATDNAEEMIKTYTRMYNRSRQAGITQQITEIVTGAQALE